MADGGAGEIEFTLEPAEAGGDDAGDAKRPAQRDRIVEAVLAADVGFWRGADGDAFARVPLPDGGLARYRVRGRAFALVVRGIYGRANPRAVAGRTVPGGVGDAALRDALPQFEAIAFERPVREPRVRVARFDGAVWLDLVPKEWLGPAGAIG